MSGPCSVGGDRSTWAPRANLTTAIILSSHPLGCRNPIQSIGRTSDICKPPVTVLEVPFSGFLSRSLRPFSYPVCSRQRSISARAPNTSTTALCSALAPSMTISDERLLSSPRSTRSRAGPVPLRCSRSRPRAVPVRAERKSLVRSFYDRLAAESVPFRVRQYCPVALPHRLRITR
jgi:hypothetical protein